MSGPVPLDNFVEKNRRRIGLAVVLLGWMCAGVEMALMVPTARPAIQDFIQSGSLRVPSTLGIPDKVQADVLVDQWFSYLMAAFLLGGACGGWLFGWMADCKGRGRAIAASIACYSVVTGLSYWAPTPHWLLCFRFVACLGVGGMWPSGVALLSEEWPQSSRSAIAGLMGAAANVGFLLLGLVMLQFRVTPDSWRWVLMLGAAPLPLAWIAWRYVPESSSWHQERVALPASVSAPWLTLARPPWRNITLLGIALGTIPLLGGWASGQRLVPWAAQVGETLGRPELRAWTQTVQAIGAVLGSLCGGWIAAQTGPRASYGLISLGSLLLSWWIFLGLDPSRPLFLPVVFLLGFVATSFYGWLPYYLPGLFPTSVRASGVGICYNSGRVFSAAALFATAVLAHWFGGDVGRMGAATSLIYLLGLTLVFWIPRSR